MDKMMALRSIFRTTSSRSSRFSAISHRCLAAVTSSSSSTRSFFTLSSPQIAVPPKNTSSANIEGVARNENVNEESNLETYLVFVDEPEGKVFATQQDLDDWYKSILPATIPKADLQRRMVSTDNLFFGFVAKLTADEARAVQKRDEVLSARRERLLPLLATHSPNKSR